VTPQLPLKFPTGRGAGKSSIGTHSDDECRARLDLPHRVMMVFETCAAVGGVHR